MFMQACICFAVSLVYVLSTAQQIEELKLVGSDTQDGDAFGHAVAISGDIAIVGAPRDDDAGADSGSAYLFDATTGEQRFKLIASDGAAGDWFGQSVGISGNVAIVARHGTTTSAAAIRLVRPTLFDVDAPGNNCLNWYPTIYLTATGSVSPWRSNGNTAVIGRQFDDNVGDDDAGSAYLFDVTTGQQNAQTRWLLTVQTDDNFG